MNKDTVTASLSFSRLRWYVHLRRAKAQLLFGCGAVVVGIVALLFASLVRASEKSFSHLIYDYPWAPFIVTPICGMVCLWIVRRWFVGIEGGGIPQVMVEQTRTEGDSWPPLVSLRLAVGKVLLCTASIGAGFSLGRYAPTVQIGASLMVALQKYLPRSAHIDRNHLLVAGGAAGIAAAFNTPLAGIMFAIEELNRKVASRMTGNIIMAIVLAGFTARALIGNHSYYGQVLVTGSKLTAFGMIVLCSLVSGVAGGLFAHLLTRWNTRPDTWLARVRQRYPYRLVAGCGLLIALLGYVSGGAAYGSGFTATAELLGDKIDMPWFYGPVKFLATVFSAVSGLPGGIVGPSLAIGAGIGNDLAMMYNDSAYSGMLIVFCMVGFLAATTQAPITAFVIVMEMVDGYALVIGLMLCAMISARISRFFAPPMFQFLASLTLRRLRKSG